MAHSFSLACCVTVQHRSPERDGPMGYACYGADLLRRNDRRSPELPEVSSGRLLQIAADYPPANRARSSQKTPLQERHGLELDGHLVFRIPSVSEFEPRRSWLS